MSIDLDNLERLAREAIYMEDGGTAPTNVGYLSTPNQAYVRACSPSAVLALSADNERMRAALASIARGFDRIEGPHESLLIVMDGFYRGIARDALSKAGGE